MPRGVPRPQRREAGAGQRAGLADAGQAAKYLGVAQSTIRKWSDVGRVPAFYTPGGHRRYRRRDLDEFLDRSGPGAAPPRGPARTDRRRRQAAPRVRPRQPRDRGLRGARGGSAEEGLAALEEQSPDLILLDVMMPQVDGWEMLRRIQERHGVGAIPVIMFSGKVDEESPPRPRRAARRGSSASRSTRSS